MVLRFSFLSARVSGCCRGRLEAPSSSKRRRGRFVTEKSKKFFPDTFFPVSRRAWRAGKVPGKNFWAGAVFFQKPPFFLSAPCFAACSEAACGEGSGAAPVLTSSFAVRFMGSLPEFGQNKRGKLLSGWKKVCRVGMWHVVAPPSGGARRIRLVLQRSCSCFPYGRAC